jgi:hypothetical protein
MGLVLIEPVFTVSDIGLVDGAERAGAGHGSVDRRKETHVVKRQGEHHLGRKVLEQVLPCRQGVQS